MTGSLDGGGRSLWDILPQIKTLLFQLLNMNDYLFIHSFLSLLVLLVIRDNTLSLQSFTALPLKLSFVDATLEGLDKIQILIQQVWDQPRLRFCSSNKLSGEGDSASLQTILSSEDLQNNRIKNIEAVSQSLPNLAKEVSMHGLTFSTSQVKKEKKCLFTESSEQRRKKKGAQDRGPMPQLSLYPCSQGRTSSQVQLFSMGIVMVDDRYALMHAFI